MNPLPTIALSVHQPWAWLIVHGHKTVENRSRLTSFRGPVLIHASKAMTMEELEAARLAAIRNGIEEAWSLADLSLRGGIVGVAEIVDCQLITDDPWHMPGNFAWKLANARPLDFMPCIGSLGFFKVSYQEPRNADGDGRREPAPPRQ